MALPAGFTQDALRSLYNPCTPGYPVRKVEPKELPPLSVPHLIRFWNSVDRTGEHWLWTGKMTGAKRTVPTFQYDTRQVSARRVAWMFAVGRRHRLSGPKSLLFPQCGEPRCIRPDHMTVREAGRNRREACGRGHKFTKGNIYITTQGKRACRQCIREQGQARRARYLKEGRGWGRNYRPMLTSNGDKKSPTMPDRGATRRRQVGAP